MQINKNNLHSKNELLVQKLLNVQASVAQKKSTILV